MGAALALLELYALSGISMAKEPGEWEVQNISEHPEEETDQIGETQIFDDIEENGQIIITDMGMLPAKRLSVIDIYYENPVNSYQELKVPSQYIRQGGYYFIVDTYRDQVLYTQNPNKPVKDWQVMAGDMNRPHAIAGDGEVWLVVDTDNNRVLVFERMNGRFENTQRFDQIGLRPHDIKYDDETDSFFVWSSMTGEMYILKRDSVSGRMCIQEVRKICELDNYYIRSFTMMGNMILFVSGTNGYMLLVDKNSFKVLQRYPVSDEIAGMACVKVIEDSFYITVACDLYGRQEGAVFIRTNDLCGLREGDYENLSVKYGLQGIPYYIEQIDDCYYMTNHCTPMSVFRFQATDNGLSQLEVVY